MLIEVGPATMMITGEKDGLPYPADAHEVEAYVAHLLGQVREALPVLRQKAFRIKKTASLPEPARRMVEAVKVVDEATLTPMAAVAGVLADLVKEYLAARHPDFISVNNGGDIAISNSKGRAIRISIGDIDRNAHTPYRLKVEGLHDFGLASSGFGGRSFTLGLADVVTVVGASGGVADAAATFICNKTVVETGGIVRRKASELDPLTDIPDALVTVERGPLSSQLVGMALANGREEAQKLKSAGIIMDAVIVLKEQMVNTLGDKSNFTLEVSNGN